MCAVRLFVGFCQALTFATSAAALQPAGGQTEFVPVNKLPPVDQMPAAPLVVAAYAFIWLAVMFYLWSIWRRLTRIEREMRALDQRVNRSRTQ